MVRMTLKHTVIVKLHQAHSPRVAIGEIGVDDHFKGLEIFPVLDLGCSTSWFEVLVAGKQELQLE